MDALDLKPGMIIEVEGIIYSVISAVHTHQQQRRGMVRCKVKELKSGKSNEFVWRSDVRINLIIVEESSLTFLYRDSSGFHFMDSLSFEESCLSSEIVGDNALYMKENDEITGLIYEGKILDIKVPFFVELKVVETDPGFRGDTVQAAKKPATLETGLVVQVPLFINAGDIIQVDTRTGGYVTRV